LTVVAAHREVGATQRGFVSLRQRPQVSSRTIAANRANAQKSTTPRRKARVTLNALKHEATAQKLFRSHLVCRGRTWPCTAGCTVRFVFTSVRWAMPRGAGRTAGAEGLVLLPEGPSGGFVARPKASRQLGLVSAAGSALLGEGLEQSRNVT